MPWMAILVSDMIANVAAALLAVLQAIVSIVESIVLATQAVVIAIAGAVIAGIDAIALAHIGVIESFPAGGARGGHVEEVLQVIA